MKHLFIVANWKANKTAKEAEDWINKFKNANVDIANKEIIICPSFTLLGFLKAKIVEGNLPLKLGSQDVSHFEEGPYTGEVSARQVKEFADYTIIGHSERRKWFKEAGTFIDWKIDNAVEFGLTPIFCIESIEQLKEYPTEINPKFFIVAYEPVFAIGSGNPDTPEDANKIAIQIKEEVGEVKILYGGSVTSQNVKSFTSMESIDGVLVGGASLDASEFGKIIKNA